MSWKCPGLVSHFKLSFGGQTEWSPLECNVCCMECGPPTVGLDTLLRTSLNLGSAILESTLLQALGWALEERVWVQTLRDHGLLGWRRMGCAHCRVDGSMDTAKGRLRVS